MQIKMFDCTIAGGGKVSSGFIVTPEWIKIKKAIVNVQNSDEKCYIKIRQYKKVKQI